MTMGRSTFLPYSKDDDGDEGVANVMESSVNGAGLSGHDGERGGVNEGVV